MSDVPGVEAVRVLIRCPQWTDGRDDLGRVLGAPTFDDGAGWAQFDASGARVLLENAPAGAPTATALMIKVADLVAAHNALSATAAEMTPIRAGGHEDLFDVRTASGIDLVVYQPRPER